MYYSIQPFRWCWHCWTTFSSCSQFWTTASQVFFTGPSQKPANCEWFPLNFSPMCVFKCFLKLPTLVGSACIGLFSTATVLLVPLVLNSSLASVIHTGHSQRLTKCECFPCFSHLSCFFSSHFLCELFPLKWSLLMLKKLHSFTQQYLAS